MVTNNTAPAGDAVAHTRDVAAGLLTRAVRTSPRNAHDLATLATAPLVLHPDTVAVVESLLLERLRSAAGPSTELAAVDVTVISGALRRLLTGGSTQVAESS